MNSQRERERVRDTEKERKRHKGGGAAGGGRGEMDGGEEGWMLRCAGGAHDNTIMNRIMLRFRPIAPKPATRDPVSGGLLPENKNMLPTSKRVKRKYVRVRKNNGYRRKKGTAKDKAKEEMDKRFVTLQLLPDKSDLKESLTIGSSCDLDRTVVTGIVQETRDPSMCLNIENPKTNDLASFGVSDLTVEMQQMRVVESSVTVECVTDTCMGGGGLGSTDKEKMKNLERDTSPGFISDCLNKVQFVNEAYRKMVRQQLSDGQPPAEIMVSLKIKEKLPYMYATFTCQVKLQYTWGKEKYSQTVPCDVWRMDCGGFAWKLDVNAALSLGR